MPGVKRRYKVGYTVSTGRRESCRSWIRLSGKWLSKLGYEIGSTFTVTVEGNRLILGPLTPSSTNTDITLPTKS